MLCFFTYCYAHLQLVVKSLEKVQFVIIFFLWKKILIHFFVKAVGDVYIRVTLLIYCIQKSNLQQIPSTLLRYQSWYLYPHRQIYECLLDYNNWSSSDWYCVLPISRLNFSFYGETLNELKEFLFLYFICLQCSAFQRTVSGIPAIMWWFWRT